MNKIDEIKLFIQGEHRPDLYSHHILDRETNDVIASFHNKPINYFDRNGYSKCDLTLTPEDNWEFEFVNRTNNFITYLNDSTDPNNPTLASFEMKNSQGVNRWINYKMFGANPSMGIATENKMLYPDCFEGIDLEYVIDTWRLKENIIIKHALDKYSYSFTLKLDGAILEQQQDGSILFVDVDTKEILWRIDAPYAFDSEGERTNNVSYSIELKEYNGGEYQCITVSLDDDEFVSSAVFPITIDPTTNYNVDTANSKILYVINGGAVTIATLDTIIARKSFNGGSLYNTSVGISLHDTSVIPDSAIISNARFGVNFTSIGLYEGADYRNLVADWHNVSTLTASDYIDPITPNAYNTQLSQYATGGQILQLLNVTNVNKTGVTGLRWGISGVLNSCNFIIMMVANSTYLEVTYTLGFSGKVNKIQFPAIINKISNPTKINKLG